jgi:hypothetical protein
VKIFLHLYVICPENLNIIRTYRGGGVAQVVECLSSKHEALSSNTSTAKEGRKEGRKCKHFLFTSAQAYTPSI